MSGTLEGHFIGVGLGGDAVDEHCVKPSVVSKAKTRHTTSMAAASVLQASGETETALAGRLGQFQMYYK